ncbi:MAG: cytochrome c [Acidobacteria bacterium]|nr:cytochrome c [Acidobacteriota bacterium]
MKAKIAAVVIGGLAALGALYSALWAQPAAAPQSTEQTSRSVWDGVYTEEQTKRGETLSGRECASCHGDGLTGGEAAPPLAGGAFLANWDGLTVGDLFDRIRKTMPQDDPKRLSREQDADVLAYILSVNGFPAGKTELGHQTEMLKQIRFEAAKPDRNK